MPNDYPLSVLPTPTKEEVEGFRALCYKKYGTDLDPVDANRQLAGLMRFLYLTRTEPPAEREERDQKAFDGTE